jgi:hypothetical protein
MMDDEFYWERARHIRELADKVDPSSENFARSRGQLRRNGAAISSRDGGGSPALPNISAERISGNAK